MKSNLPISKDILHNGNNYDPLKFENLLNKFVKAGQQQEKYNNKSV